MKPAISILIPAYNAEKFLLNCLQSIGSQSFKNFEIIVSNDGSRDKTVEIVEDFISKNPQIKVILLNNENGGVSKARQRALEVASGEWITFVDADDTLPPNALEDSYAASGDDTDLVVGFLIPPKDKIEEMSTSDQWQRAVVEGVIPPCIGAKLYRHSILLPKMLDIPRNITNGEDALMNIAYVFNMSKPPRFIYNHIYNYVRQPLSLSHSIKRSIELEYEYDTFRLKAIPKEFHKKYMAGITKYRLNGIICCSRSDTETIRRKEHPFFHITQEGIKQSGYRVNFFEYVVLNCHNPKILRYSAFIRSIFISLKYRLYTLFRR